MLWKILLFASHLYCCLCQVAYELDVQGEAQHGYYVTVSIGHPPQDIKLLIDTGSANFAIAIIPPLNGSSNFFHYTDSDTFEKLGSKVDIHYVQGSWSGFLATDLVIVSKNHSVRCAISCMTSIHNVFDINSKFAGILGFAYPTPAKPNSSFLDAIGKGENYVFSLSLCGPTFSSTEIHTSCGKLHLGFISTHHYTNEIIYTPIVKEQLYEITLTAIRVGSEQIVVDCKELNNPRSSVDSGTTQLLVSSLVYNILLSKIKIYAREKIQKQSKMTENINDFWLNETAACIPKEYFDISFFPDLSISLYYANNASFDLVISPELYLLPWRASETTCFILGIGKSNFGTIIGSTLLKGYYIIFDRANRQIGFANSSFWKKEMKSFVTMPSLLLGTNYSNCKHIESTQNDSNTISAGTIILLIFVLILTVLMLYKIISWVQAIRFQQSDNHSDTSSLVSEEYKI